MNQITIFKTTNSKTNTCHKMLAIFLAIQLPKNNGEANKKKSLNAQK